MLRTAEVYIVHDKYFHSRQIKFSVLIGDYALPAAKETLQHEEKALSDTVMIVIGSTMTKTCTVVGQIWYVRTKSCMYFLEGFTSSSTRAIHHCRFVHSKTSIESPSKFSTSQTSSNQGCNRIGSQSNCKCPKDVGYIRAPCRL